MQRRQVHLKMSAQEQIPENAQKHVQDIFGEDILLGGPGGVTTGVPWGWWDYSCWWWWQWIIHCGFGVRRVFFIILSVFRAFLNIFSSPSSVKEEKVNLARKCSCLQTFANTSQEAQKINCKKNTNKKSKCVQCITWGDQLPSIKFLLLCTIVY